MAENNTILADERQLFARMAGGDEDAFAKIFHHYNKSLFPFLISKVKSRELAEEMVQDVFLKLWDKRNSLHEIDNYRSYIFMMGVNLAYSHFKRAALETRVQKQLWDAIEAERTTTEEMVDFNETQSLVNQAVDRLPPAQRKIYLLSRQKGLSHEEIAQELNISKRTVSNQVTSALQFIKEYLQSKGGTSVAVVMIVLRHFRG
jgi:RNA polymerase sigma-70 factor (ECF subfamily)